MLGNITNYYEQEEYSTEIQIYKDIINSQDVALAISTLDQYLDLIPTASELSTSDFGEYDLRSVESAHIIFLVLKEICNDSDTLEKYRKKIELALKISQIKDGKKFAD